MTDSIERLAFELTAAALAEQERAVSSLRLSAGTVLGAGSITASLAVARTGNHTLNVWAFIATLSYALCFASAICVLLPRNLVLSFGGSELMADAESEVAPDVADGYRAASSWIEPYLERNRMTIIRLADWLTVSCGLLILEVVLCTIGVTS
jgi:hypothetical protein